MDIKGYLQNNHITIREMAAITAIPYSTLNDIVNNKVNLEECQYKTLKKISVFLKISMDDLVYRKEDFQTFRNNLHHELKNKNNLDVILCILEERRIDYHILHGDMLKALYLLSLLDYLSKENKIPLCTEYSELRGKTLASPYYVGDFGNIGSSATYLDEFVRHNIYEGELYDAV